MVNAQEWLDRKYSEEERENMTILNINNQGLEGKLKLEGFNNLETLICSNNYLTSLDIDACSLGLKELNCSNNKLTELDLSTTWCLEKLDCSNNNLTDLKKLLDGLNKKNLLVTSSSDSKLGRAFGWMLNESFKFVDNKVSKFDEMVNEADPSKGKIKYLDIGNNHFLYVEYINYLNDSFKNDKFDYLKELYLRNDDFVNLNYQAQMEQPPKT